jgi:hypothetical protein
MGASTRIGRLSGLRLGDWSDHIRNRFSRTENLYFFMRKKDRTAKAVAILISSQIRKPSTRYLRRVWSYLCDQ